MTEEIDYTKRKPVKTAKIKVTSDIFDQTIFSVHHLVAFNTASNPIHQIDLDKPTCILILPQDDESVKISTIGENGFMESLREAMNTILRLKGGKYQ